MKLLYLDFLLPTGHTKQNESYIELLSSFAHVYVVSDSERYSVNNSNIKYIFDSNLTIRDGKLKTRVDTIKVMEYSLKVAKDLSPDIVFVSSYDTIAFAFYAKQFSRRWKTFVLQHSNVDELENRVKKAIFKLYMKEINLVVFEEFIKNYLLETFDIFQKKVYVLPHQKNTYKNELENHNNAYTYDCIGLSFSNDEDTISEILRAESNFEHFKINKKKVVLKSKHHNFDNGYLRVVNGYIPDEAFSEYINNTKCVYMPFPKSFKYRMSGTLIDALSKKSIVIANRIPLIEHYSAKYTVLCRIADSATAFIDAILSANFNSDYEGIENDYNRFSKEHSNEAIVNSFKEMFELSE